MKNTPRMCNVVRRFEAYFEAYNDILSSLVCVIVCLNCLYNRYIWEFTYKIINSTHSAL